VENIGSESFVKLLPHRIRVDLIHRAKLELAHVIVDRHGSLQLGPTKRRDI
jgi:hypothetical protein